MVKKILLLVISVIVWAPQLITAQDMSNPHVLYYPMQSEENKVLCQRAKESGEFYYKLWKNYFLKKNNMHPSYFENHIYAQYYIYCKWETGEVYFVTNYTVKYDWASIHQSDRFLILVFKEMSGYENLLKQLRGYNEPIIKRGHLFNEEEVAYAIDHEHAHFSDIKSFASLLYSSREAALKVLREKIGYPEISDIELSIRKDGFPYLQGSFKDFKNLRNTVGYLNLMTGEVIVEKHTIIVD